ncbi:MAG: holo-ACP synthase [Clostridium sp.]|uniref:holo-ACP synthase n=1 Tax=Clostridium sp. TaxID=1506 RepID=UPI003F3F06A3
MIYGIGNDIIEINRIQKAIERTESFLFKVFTEEEIEYFKSKNMKMETIAGNFAGKEAFSKALGTGFRGIGLRDIEILRNSLGRPYIKVSEEIVEKFKLEKSKFHVTISHNKTSAIAMVIIEE